jgi:hypothetical protein
MFDNMWPDFMPVEGTTPASRGVMPAFGSAAGKYFLQQSGWPSSSDYKVVTYRLFHMFGDAFQEIYTEIPTQLTVTHEQEIIYGATSFTIQTNDSAFIALTLDDQILATGYGSSNGPVSLAIPLIPDGSQVKVTVTKHNFYRYNDLVPVTPSTGGSESIVAKGQALFSIYPNPTPGNFKLKQQVDILSGKLMIEIFNSHGEKVMNETMISEKQHDFSFSIMSAGIYFLKITADGYIETIKLVKF